MRIQTPPRKRYDGRRSRTPSSLRKRTLGVDHRATRSTLGRKGEIRVRNLLSKIYKLKVFLGTGTNGHPDVQILSNPPILVEVKTCELMKKCGSLGGAKTFIHSWKRLTLYAKSRRMERMMVIEFRHKAGFLYIWLDGKKIDSLMEEKIENDVFHIDFRTALKHGEILSDKVPRLSECDTVQRSFDYFV